MQRGVSRTFYEPGEFPWLAPLAESLSEIQAEARSVIEGYRSLRWLHPEIYDSSRRGVEGQRATFYLEIYGMQVESNRVRCPAACRAVSAVPGLVTAGIYLLDARSKILPHVGATNVVLRGHMGLICPPGCFLRVGPDTRCWGEGEFLVFDDTVEHEAWNETDELRAILMFDFFHRPHTAEERNADLLALRERYLGAADYLWLQAADTACPGQFEPARLAERRAAVAPFGLYFS